MEKVKILIVDDQNLLRVGLQSIIDLEPDMEVIGTARNGQEACELVKKLLPDVVLLDVLMEPMNGIESTRWIKTHYPQVKVIVLTDLETEETLLQALAAGANGFVYKNVGWKQLLKHIRYVMEDQLLLDVSVANVLSHALSRMISSAGMTEEDKKRTVEDFQFNEKEIEIVELIARGYNNREIAALLKYSDGTIRNYISTIYNKIGIHNRSQAVIQLRALGLGK